MAAVSEKCVAARGVSVGNVTKSVAWRVWRNGNGRGWLVMKPSDNTHAPSPQMVAWRKSTLCRARYPHALHYLCVCRK